MISLPGCHPRWTAFPPPPHTHTGQHSSWTAPPWTAPPSQPTAPFPNSTTPMDNTKPWTAPPPGQQMGGKHPIGMLSRLS